MRIHAMAVWQEYRPKVAQWLLILQTLSQGVMKSPRSLNATPRTSAPWQCRPRSLKQCCAFFVGTNICVLLSFSQKKNEWIMWVRILRSLSSLKYLCPFSALRETRCGRMRQLSADAENRASLASLFLCYGRTLWNKLQLRCEGKLEF